MSRLASIFGLILLLAIVGCGTEPTAQPHTSTGRVQISDCGGSADVVFRLYEVDCEIANTLIVMLDGHALRQSVIFTAEGKRRGAWVCTSPTHSLYAPLHCQQGARYFTAAYVPRREDYKLPGIKPKTP